MWKNNFFPCFPKWVVSFLRRLVIVPGRPPRHCGGVGKPDSGAGGRQCKAVETGFSKQLRIGAIKKSSCLTEDGLVLDRRLCRASDTTKEGLATPVLTGKGRVVDVSVPAGKGKTVAIVRRVFFQEKYRHGLCACRNKHLFFWPDRKRTGRERP